MKDPIVAEIHRIREQIWEECHGSAKEMGKMLRLVQEQYKDRLIDQKAWKRQRKAGQRR